MKRGRRDNFIKKYKKTVDNVFCSVKSSVKISNIHIYIAFAVPCECVRNSLSNQYINANKLMHIANSQLSRRSYDVTFIICQVLVVSKQNSIVCNHDA